MLVAVSMAESGVDGGKHPVPWVNNERSFRTITYGVLSKCC